MKIFSLTTLFTSLILSLVQYSQFGLCQEIKQSSIVQPLQQVDGNGRYWLGWQVDFENETIIFDVVAQTLGFVGFGLSPKGAMTGADIFIAGVFKNGDPYFSDWHATKNGFPIEDEEQDWDLIEASENATHTTLRFARFLDTCDPNNQDIAITTDTLKVIWSFGEKDEIRYHGVNRGSYAVDLLSAPVLPMSKDEEGMEVWDVTRDIVMPSQHTTYWCSIHKSPDFGDKKHVVGFKTKLDNPEALKHTHHAVVWACTPPEGQNATDFFEPFTTSIGAECYDRQTLYLRKLPIINCRSMLNVWAVGGKPLVLPDHVGYAVKDYEYIMMEIHYDNPDMLEGVQFETGVQVYYTSNLRPNDAGIILVDHYLVASHMVPPKVNDFTVVGHCAPSCTMQHFPPGGINLINVLLHSHLAATKLKLRHFRGSEELPWAAKDDNYAFDYQQNKFLLNEVNVLPGDQLSYECTYNTMDRDKVTVAGLSTRNEMCEAFIWYYPKMDLTFCGSLYPFTSRFYTKFGVENTTQLAIGEFDPTVLDPKELAGLKFSEAVDKNYKWTKENKAELQRMLRYDPHLTTCRLQGQGLKPSANLLASYPKNVKEFQPNNTCGELFAQYDNEVNRKSLQ